MFYDLNDVETVNVEYEDEDGKLVKRTHYFYKKQDGLVPQLCSEMINKRNEVRKIQKTATGQDWENLESLQK